MIRPASRSVLWAAAKSWLIAHAILHLWEVAVGICAPSAIVRDFPAVTLPALNRLDEPTGGSVLLDGQDYRTIASQELRRRVGMVMQMAYLFPGTVAANIAFGPPAP